jgi:hypothetical protein
VLKVLQEFPKSCFLGVAMKSPRDACTVSSVQTRVMALEFPNSWSARWIVLKCLQEFPEACFLSVAIKSWWDAGGVSSGQTRVSAHEVRNSWSNHWTVLKFYRSFKRLFSLASHYCCYSTPTTSSPATPRTRQEYRLKRFVTIDPTVGSSSNFYRSSKRGVCSALQWNRH